MDEPTIGAAALGPLKELSRLFELSPQMLCVAGTDGRFRHVNPGFGKTLGFSREELLSRPFMDFVHPDDRKATLAEIRKLAEGVPAIQFENRYRCKDGTFRWLAWTVAAVRESGLLYATAVDVTEHRRTEILFRQLLESAPDAMIIADANGKIMLANKLAEQNFGYRQEELLGREIEFLIPGRFRDRHRDYVGQFRAAPRRRPMGSGIEVWALRKDGSEFPAEVSLGPLETESGLLVLAALRDITDRKRMEQSLREKDAQLLAAQKIQERLLPEASPRVPGFDIFGACYPAEFAAGDYFDYIPLEDDGLGVVVADVAGHGIGSALVTAMTRARLRSLAEIGSGIDEILARANRILFEETEPDIFVTVLFARLDPRNRALTYASAGHPTAIVLDRRGELKASLPSLSPPLGILPDAIFPTSGPIGLEPGDIVLLFTDGLAEAADVSGLAFGETRILEVVRRHRDGTAREIAEALRLAIVDFSGERKSADDITLVVIKA